jgi:hypothetical protein
MGDKLVHNSMVHMMQQPPKSERDVINDNTDKDGVVSCHKCEKGNLNDREGVIGVSIGFNKVSQYKLTTLFCNNCDYLFLQDQEVKEIREFLSN